MSNIAYEILGVPKEHWDKLSPEAPFGTRMAVAKALLPLPPDVLMGMAFALVADPDKRIAKTARQTLREMPSETVIRSLTPRTHPKLLEFLASFRSNDDALMEKVYRNASASDEVVLMIAGRASEDLIEAIARNQERLLMTPKVYLALRENPNTTPAQRDRVAQFLRHNRCLPEIPGEEVGEEPPVVPEDPDALSPLEEPVPLRATPSEPLPDPETLLRLAVEVEIAAALAGYPSPSTNPHVAEQMKLSGIQVIALREAAGFEFALDETGWDFSLELLSEEELPPDKKLRMSEFIATLSPGKKIKLAYLGNGDARKILLRDSNKLVACAVIKSKRMSDSELIAAAGNRNLPADVFREIALDREMVRKYPVKAALVNNPKCPVNIALTLMRDLNSSDLEKVARNKNVSSVISGLAAKKVKEKKG